MAHTTSGFPRLGIRLSCRAAELLLLWAVTRIFMKNAPAFAYSGSWGQPRASGVAARPEKATAKPRDEKTAQLAAHFADSPVYSVAGALEVAEEAVRRAGRR
jgi:hypothetical protein